MEPVTIKLSKPIKSVDREFTELTLREPTGKDLRLAGGLPLRSDGVVTEIDTERVARLIESVAGISSQAVDSMSGVDFQKCAIAMTGFLGGTAPNS